MATASRKAFSKADTATTKMLDARARSLLAARHLVGDGDCKERAVAALEEASAILKDAAQNCRDAPFLEKG